jgi:hypothetical protein
MNDTWSYVIASYVITWVALIAYVRYVTGRANGALESLRHDTGESTR